MLNIMPLTEKYDTYVVIASEKLLNRFYNIQLHRQYQNNIVIILKIYPDISVNVFFNFNFLQVII